MLNRFPFVVVVVVVVALFFSCTQLYAQNEKNGTVKISETKPGEYTVENNGKLLTIVVAKGTDLAKPYLYPIHTPAGIPVTRDWPMKKGAVSENETVDHVHQKSAWFCHGDVIPEGVTLKIASSDKHVKGVDFWAESKGHGQIITRTANVSENKLALELDWNAPEGLTILKEKRIYQFLITEKANVILMTTNLTAHEFAITFGDTKEGAFGVRVHDAMNMKVKNGDGMITNSNGKQGMKDCWGMMAEWCDYSGTINGQKAGIAIFDFTGNPHRSAWHVRDYGLMAANPFGRKVSGFPSQKEKTETVKIAKGESLTLKYAIYAHDGDFEKGEVKEQFKSLEKLFAEQSQPKRELLDTSTDKP